MAKKFDWIGPCVTVLFAALMTCSFATVGYIMFDLYSQKMEIDAGHLKLEQDWNRDADRMREDLEEIRKGLEALEQQRKGHDATTQTD